MINSTQTIDHTLKKTFEFNAFKPGQRQVAELVSSGKSAVAIFPTGAGKSLCYQLPALHEPGMTLVISPLLSLMKDQVEFLQSKNIAAAKLDSGLPSRQYRQILEAARLGDLKILMIAVERFKNERFRTQLRQMNISLLVVDEAHCISEWGHNFRPDYLKIPHFQKEFNINKTLLLTATATSKVISDMCEKFSISQEHVVKTGFYRKNLFLRIRPVLEKDKDSLLRQVLAGKPAGPAIVYVTLQKTAENVARMLQQHGFDAEAYHAGMKNEQREDIQNRFMAGKNGIVTATIAFGMGIDKQDIRKVIHYDLPKSMEGYSQEIGRAGRDQEPCLCCMLANRSGIALLENFVYGDTPARRGIYHVLNLIKQSQQPFFEVRAHSLSKESDIRLLPLKTLLVYLEMEKIISPQYTYFEKYSFQYIKTAQEIINTFQGKRKQFVHTIFKYAKPAKTWSHLNIDAVIEESGSQRQRVLTALEYFNEKRWIHLQPKLAVEVFTIDNPGFNIGATADKLTKLFKNKEKKDVDRIHAMLEMFEKPQCLAKSLSAFFGENLDTDCARCSVCLQHPPIILPAHELPPLENHDAAALLQPLKEKALPDLSADLATRFLCGINTPRLAQYKAKEMPGFGKLEQYSFKVIEQWVTAKL
ncbi:MAG: ATP-dependent DNA helicase RecQ [Desulfobacteraceae bacterium]|nr:ATP-dependent DNA helicase RecQ [Desulfobacteraceae bacterium]